MDRRRVKDGESRIHHRWLHGDMHIELVPDLMRRFTKESEASLQVLLGLQLFGRREATDKFSLVDERYQRFW